MRRYRSPEREPNRRPESADPRRGATLTPGEHPRKAWRGAAESTGEGLRPRGAVAICAPSKGGTEEEEEGARAPTGSGGHDRARGSPPGPGEPGGPTALRPHLRLGFDADGRREFVHNSWRGRSQPPPRTLVQALSVASRGRRGEFPVVLRGCGAQSPPSAPPQGVERRSSGFQRVWTPAGASRRLQTPRHPGARGTQAGGK